MNNGPDHSAVSSPSAAAAPAAGSTYTVRQQSKDHGYVMHEGESICVASMEWCKRIAEAMNRQEREDGQVAAQQPTKEK